MQRALKWFTSIAAVYYNLISLLYNYQAANWGSVDYSYFLVSADFAEENINLEMDRWAGKIAVVTGASSGIGFGIAKALVQNGMIVVGLARRKTKMENDMKGVTGSGKFYAIECDLLIKEEIEKAFEWVKTNLKTIHVLISNAGILTTTSIQNTDIVEMKKVLDINFTAALFCSQLAMKIMKEAGHESHIVVIDCITAIRVAEPLPSPYLANIYTATKCALRALSRTLERELNDTSIRVTNICPGPVRTEMIDLISDDIPTIKDELTMIEPEDIGDAIVYVLGTPQRVMIEEMTIKSKNSHY